jgi:hypothetical protein
VCSVVGTGGQVWVFVCGGVVMCGCVYVGVL